ncbi:MAG: hypothetical protein FWC39_02135 [Bacteroidetes bacterium]|nr:hypothetical protein [Bacteroidota bacterium]
MKPNQIPLPLFLTVLNVIVCAITFIWIVFPNCYFGLTALQYMLFLSIFGILFALHIIIFLRRKTKKLQILYPLLVVIFYVGLLVGANII